MPGIRMMAGIAALALAAAAPAEALVQASPLASGDAALFDAEGYRSIRYRAPVKADPAPATAITLAAALALEPGRDALFIDVMPAEGGVRDPATGAWALAGEHLTIPGAHWYPETGRAPVEPALWRALEAHIASVQAGSPGKPVIIFCRTDCWMGWNAARRLALRGIVNVRWLAEGTDGWHAAGRALVPAVPVATPAS